jgi:hypothetical protein
MAKTRKSSRSAAPVEKIFDRLTVLVVNHELFLNGTYGPVTPQQKAVLKDMVGAAQEIGTLLRKILSP